ncbi:DUF2461 domain-containing protein [Echinicola jeungdonensis]|uniref:DUF2461 domain-containing protein n=1 Tax=Echinicola jeungdonensis TaxID=709343 RepID=A0ABV5J7R9_9BACT|nr:DUF2461 domain-containing protein [Echinicola jeungdonensis]MDN3669666.1 DUF2461 domain-containing protein [Echinicola jeungdonensis]
MMKNVLKFLEELAENNSKEWMDAHRDWYQNARSEFLELVEALLIEMVKLEPGLEPLKAKDCVFRQNRDIRFSSNKAPYKINMAALFAVEGKKSNMPGYYLHIQPGESFLAGGIWMPPPEVLKKIRQEIDYSGEEMLRIINEPSIHKRFGEIQGERLKTSPRDYNADHPYIDLLRLKSFIFTHTLSDKDITSQGLIGKIIDDFMLLKPFQDFLVKAVEDVETGEGLL